MTSDFPLFPTLQPNFTCYSQTLSTLLAFPLLHEESGYHLCFKFYFSHHPHPLKVITILQGPTPMPINSMQSFSIWVGCAVFILKLLNGLPLHFSYSIKCTLYYSEAIHACHITSVTSLNGTRYLLSCSTFILTCHHCSPILPITVL